MPDDPNRQICQCGKRCYSFREARQVIAAAKAMNHKSHVKTIPKRCYPCDICGMYHLSSKPDYRDIKRKRLKGADF